MPQRTPPAPRRVTVCLPLSTVRDRRISHEALGLLLVASSYPSDTPFGEAWFRDLLGIGRYQLRRQLRELEEHGYLERGRKRDRGGVLGSAEWRFRPFALRPAAATNDRFSARGENPAAAIVPAGETAPTKGRKSDLGEPVATKGRFSDFGSTYVRFSALGQNPVIAGPLSTGRFSVCSELNSSTNDRFSALGEPGTSIYFSYRFISKAVSSYSFSKEALENHDFYDLDS